MSQVDPVIDSLVPLAQCPERFPDLLPGRRAGRRVRPRTLLNWATRGVGGVYLKVRYAGGTACTTRAWLGEFADELTAARTGRRP